MLTGMSAGSLFGKSLPEDHNIIGSPLKKARPSISGDLGELKPGMFPPALGDILAKAEAAQAAANKPSPSHTPAPAPVKEATMEEEEEL